MSLWSQPHVHFKNYCPIWREIDAKTGTALGHNCVSCHYARGGAASSVSQLHLPVTQSSGVTKKKDGDSHKPLEHLWFLEKRHQINKAFPLLSMFPGEDVIFKLKLCTREHEGAEVKDALWEAMNDTAVDFPSNPASIHKLFQSVTKEPFQFATVAFCASDWLRLRGNFSCSSQVSQHWEPSANQTITMNSQ